jgi:hypothetical protein
MTTRLRELLEYESASARNYVREIVDGLTDDEFFWEPVADAWSIRKFGGAPTSPFAQYLAAEGGGRDWFSDEAWDGSRFLDLEPPPFTTIGWRLVHMGSCKIMYHEHAFGQRRDMWAELTSIHTAKEAIQQYDEGHRLLMQALASLDDAALDGTSQTNWGEQWPTWRIFWHMLKHDLQHGAEIGAVRDMYAHRDSLKNEPRTPHN